MENMSRSDLFYIGEFINSRESCPFIMKKVLFIITLACCCLNINAQEFKYYDFKSSCNKDTTEYLYKNFVQQKCYFVNKKLKEFLKYYEKDFEVGTANVGATSPYIDPEGKEYVEDIYIFLLLSAKSLLSV